MNLYAVKAIYRYEMARMFRTVVQSIVAPVLSTSLYFVIFGSAIGSRITEIDGVSYGSFIVPGLIMLSIMTESISNSSFAIYFPKFTGTIFEVLSAPVSYGEVVLGYVGAATTKSLIIGAIILTTASFFVDIENRASTGHDHFPVTDLRVILPVWFHSGSLGDGVGEADDCADSGDHAANLSWWHVLFNQHVATGLADDQFVQPGRLPDQWFSLEFL